MKKKKKKKKNGAINVAECDEGGCGCGKDQDLYGEGAEGDGFRQLADKPIF